MQHPKMNVHPRYVIDEKQRRKAVMLSLPEWDKIMEKLEELEDIRAYDAAKATAQKKGPFEESVRQLNQKA